MSKTAVKKGTLGYYILNACCILLMFFGGYIPSPVPEITKVGMQVLGVFIGMVVLWSAGGEIVWPSLTAIIALGMTDYTTVNGAITSALGQPVIWQVVMAIVLTATLTISGVGEIMARWLVSRKSLQGKPYLFSAIFLISFTLIAAMSSGISMMLLAWSILKGMASLLDTDIEQPWFRIMSVFLVASAGFGEFAIPFRSWVGALWNAFGEIAGQQFDYLGYLVVVLTVSITVDILMVATLKLRKVDVSFLRNFDNSKINAGFENTKLNVRQKAYIIAMVVCTGFSLVSTLLPRGTAIYKFLDTLGTGGILAIGVAALIMLKAPDGKRMMDFNEVTAKAPIWGVFFLCAAAIPVASALCTEKTGFMAFTTRVLTPLVSGSSVMMFYFLIIIVSVILTNLASNTGIGMMMLPIVVPLTSVVGANMYTVGICTILSACMGLLLPGSSGVTAVVYGVKEQQSLRMKDIVGNGLVVCGIYTVVATLLFTMFDMIMR